MTKVSDVEIFGCDGEAFLETVAKSISGPPMAAMSVLSDAQELLALGEPEAARKEINKAKLIIARMLWQPVGGVR